ncbi:MAG TPA: FKBP-type peptidyl-prolyl cis-trans isomerase [Candidatus Aquilonibacter sp.]|nr:FKBP-type peptidyl-prolyl cis-trans isomerase [Candidatus Aquilonibacter sp.]
MQKTLTSALTIFASVVLASGNILAQQNAAPTTSNSTPPSTTSRPKTSTTKKSTARTAAPLTLKTDKEKFSYALGMRMGANLKKQNVPIDPAILERGVKDALAGGKTLLTDEQAQTALMQVQNDLRKKQQEKMQAEGLENKKQGEAFLAENKTKDGVKTLPSGLEYKILKEGTGPKPAASDTVECNYRGTLIDGKEFDSSAKHGGPATFPVSGVIKGWTEALQMMPVGSKWQLFIPADLAYGDRGAGPDIGPDSTLIFEVELVSIKQPEKTGENSGSKPGDAKPADAQSKPPDQKQ